MTRGMGKFVKAKIKIAKAVLFFAFAIHIILHPQLRNYRDSFP